MTWEAWALFVVVETGLCVTPGPAVLLVLSQALVRGTASSVWSNLAVLLASYELFSAVKWIGAAYLLWLGVTTFCGRSSVFSVEPARGWSTAAGRILLNGFVLQAANPKALLFFAALLPQFIDPRGSVVRQVTILAATSVVIEFLVLLAYGALAGRMTELAAQPRFGKLANRLAGSMLITAGVGTAAIRRV